MWQRSQHEQGRSLERNNTSRFQKARYQETCNEIIDESCYSKNASGKNITQRTQKGKGKNG